MKNLLPLLLLIFAFQSVFSQEQENLDDLLKKLNGKEYSITIKKSEQNKKQRYCLVPILQTNDYGIYYPLDRAELKIGFGKSGLTNILIFNKKYRSYLVLHYFSNGYVGRINKSKYNIAFNFQGWDLINSEAVLLDNSLKPIMHIFFPSELNNISYEMKDKTMIVETSNGEYDVVLDTSFYSIPLDDLFSKFYLENKEKYQINLIDENNFFMFLKEKKICFCRLN